MSIEGGVSRVFERGETLGCTTIQMFTKNAAQWKAPPISQEETERFKAEQIRTGIEPVVAHDTYLINLATPDRQVRQKSVATLREEFKRCALLGIPFLVMHPGSHRGAGEKTGLNMIAEALSRIMEDKETSRVVLVLENTAGQGTQLGYRFEQIAWLLENIEAPAEMKGVCFDTCHAFAAGYDIRDEKSYEKTWNEFDSIIGIRRLKVIHLNDSRRGLGSRIDRHEHIGMGMIGLEAFRLIMTDERFASIPKIIETPAEGPEPDMDVRNLSILRKLALADGESGE